MNLPALILTSVAYVLLASALVALVWIAFTQGRTLPYPKTDIKKKS